MEAQNEFLAMNGDDSDCVISTRQLAILLAFIADTEQASA